MEQLAQHQLAQQQPAANTGYVPSATTYEPITHAIRTTAPAHPYTAASAPPTSAMRASHTTSTDFPPPPPPPPPTAALPTHNPHRQSHHLPLPHQHPPRQTLSRHLVTHPHHHLLKYLFPIHPFHPLGAIMANHQMFKRFPPTAWSRKQNIAGLHVFQVYGSWRFTARQTSQPAPFPRKIRQLGTHTIHFIAESVFLRGPWRYTSRPAPCGRTHSTFQSQ